MIYFVKLKGVGTRIFPLLVSHSHVFLSQSRREEEVPQRWFCDKQSPFCCSRVESRLCDTSMRSEAYELENHSEIKLMQLLTPRWFWMKVKIIGIKDTFLWYPPKIHDLCTPIFEFYASTAQKRQKPIIIIGNILQWGFQIQRVSWSSLRCLKKHY